jgi:hypothetical protein
LNRDSALGILFDHDLLEKPVSTFPDHALAGSAAGKLDGAVLLKLLFGLLGCEQRGPQQPEDKGRNGEKGDGGANFAEM